MDIQQDVIEDVVFKLHRQAAIRLPEDVKKGIQRAYEKESKKIPKYALGKVLENLQIAEEKQIPVCGDTGLPRMYVKVGNEAVIEGGIVALEGSVRKATARATADMEHSSDRRTLRPSSSRAWGPYRRSTTWRGQRSSSGS